MNVLPDAYICSDRKKGAPLLPEGTVKCIHTSSIFSYICGRINLWVELKTNGGVIFITTLLHFHYFTSLETVNTLRSKVFLLRISLGNVNASVVTCRYPQIYNFSFRKEFLETLCKCIYLGF